MQLSIPSFCFSAMFVCRPVCTVCLFDRFGGTEASTGVEASAALGIYLEEQVELYPCERVRLGQGSA
jgi:hypothetical protein